MSPWVPKGVIDHGPATGARIDPNIHYDHSSLVATVREHLFRDVMRRDGDCPDKLGKEWGVE